MNTGGGGGSGGDSDTTGSGVDPVGSEDTVGSVGTGGDDDSGVVGSSLISCLISCLTVDFLLSENMITSLIIHTHKTGKIDTKYSIFT